MFGGVVCDAANKRTRDIADNIKQMLIRGKKTRKRIRRRKKEKEEGKKIEFRTCPRKGKKAVAMVVVVVIVEQRQKCVVD